MEDPSNTKTNNDNNEDPHKDSLKIQKNITTSRAIWTQQQDKTLLNSIKDYDDNRIKWIEISKLVNKTAKQCYSLYRQINPLFTKGVWKKSEEAFLEKLVEQHGKKWALIAKIFKTRSGKQIRHHYLNILDSNNKKKGFTPEEDLKIKELYLQYGPKWKLISTHF